MENNIKWGYNENNDFFIDYGKSIRWVNDFKTECELTSLKIKDDFKGTLCLLFSGGLYSTVVAKSLVSMDIPFYAITCKYTNNENKKEVDFASNFCKKNNIEHKIIELNVEDFIKSEYKKYTEVVKNISPLQSTHCWLFDLCNDIPIVGNGFMWMNYNLKNNEFKITERDYWYYIEKWKIFRNREAVTQFFKYNTELVNSQILDFYKIIKKSDKNNFRVRLSQRGYDMNYYLSSYIIRKTLFLDQFRVSNSLNNKFKSFGTYTFIDFKEVKYNAFEILDKISYDGQNIL